MKQKLLGVIGGLGSETGCRFCLNVNNKFKSITGRQPHILLDNLPISKEAEERLINGGLSEEHFNLLAESVKRLNQLNAKLIVIACNTLHIFIDELRKKSKVSILSIVEETAKECKTLGIRKVGLLASTKTIKSGLHTKELEALNINVITPNETDQQFVNECIIRIINQKTKNDDRTNMIKIIEKLEKKGAQGIILGCTDLPILLSNKNINALLINTLKILENATINCLISEN